jgi:hypothetical protein
LGAGGFFMPRIPLAGGADVDAVISAAVCFTSVNDLCSYCQTLIKT